MKKIIDYFPFFIEKELLELRVNLLKDHVDKFIISETNKTHNGDSKEFICKKVIGDLNLPKDKIQVIETIIPEDHEITPEECDYVYASEAKSTKPKNWSRERIQRDALMNYIDEYDDDTVFIMSDCDEIINPNFLSNFSNICRSLDDNIIKVPLVLLEGRADKRIYDNDIPVDWDRSMVLCAKKHLKNGGTPTKFRGEYLNPFPPLWIYQNEKLVKDCGWHFTWMGDKNSKKYKAKTSVLSDNLLALNNLSSNSMDGIVNDTNNTRILKDYPVELLPNIIFSLPKVKDFLFPIEEKQTENIFNFSNKSKSTVWVLDNFYETPEKVREFALEQEYFEGGIGRGFIGRRTHKQFLFPGLKEKFEEIMGRKITAWEEHTENGKFQIAWAGEPLVYHWDSQKWGAVLYLTPDAPFECGTTLFAHKKTRGRNFYEVSYNDAFSGVLNETTTHLDRTPFEPVDVMGNVFNRLIIFDGSCIHSASEYFGCNKNSGRLWQMFFFDTE